MSDIETRARAAGRALRRWAPDTTTPVAETVATRAVRRTLVHRAAVGAIAAGVLATVAVVWTGPDRGRDVETTPGPADAPDTPVPTTDGGGSTTPTTIGDTTTTTDAAATVTAPTAAEPLRPPLSSPCTAQVGESSVTVEVTLPEGWYTNQADLGMPACFGFGPDPVTVRLVETETSDMVPATDGVVQFRTPYPAGQLPGPFEQYVTSTEGQDGVVDTQRTTIDGHAAARSERVTTPGDGNPAGNPYVLWQVDLGEIWLEATVDTPQDLPEGMTHAQAVAAFDQIMTSLQIG